MSPDEQAHLSQLDADARELAALGYQQELRRGLGAFSNFAISLSIISILTGAVTLYGHGLVWGGPFGVVVGWILVAVMTLPVAASLAQLASSFPTAGALYHWAAILGGPGWGFATAWLNVIGQVAITAGIDYGMARLVLALLDIPADTGMVLLTYGTILLSHAVLNHVGVRAVEILGQLSAWYHLVGAAVLVLVLALLAPRQPLSFLAVQVSEAADYRYGFALALLQAQWTFTGYDASAHVTEETMDPSRNAPRGIMWSVVVSAVVGLALLIAVTLAIGDLAAARAAKEPFLHIVTLALGPTLGAAAVWLCVGAMWFCGLSSLTSNSRMVYAFARDGGMPGSRWLARVSPTRQSPATAVWVSALAAFVVVVWAEALAAVTALSTIALYASYALPIAVGLFARLQGRWQRRGPWDLGRWSTLINLIALAWSAVVLVLFVLPPNELAGYTFVATLALLTIWWFGWVRRHFSPPVAHLRG